MKNNLSVECREGKTEDLYKVTVKVKGRRQTNAGICRGSISGCSGERLANLMMKCLTKARESGAIALWDAIDGIEKG